MSSHDKRYPQDDDEESYDLFGDNNNSESEDIDQSESNYSYEEADPNDESDFDDEPISGSKHRMAKRMANLRRQRSHSSGRMDASSHHSRGSHDNMRRQSFNGGGGSSHSRGSRSFHDSGFGRSVGGRSAHSRSSFHDSGFGRSVGGRSTHSRERLPPDEYQRSRNHGSRTGSAYSWNDSYSHGSFSGPPGSIVMGGPQSGMMVDDDLTMAYPQPHSVSGPPGSMYGQQDRGFYGGGGFASRIRQKLPQFEPNQDTRKLCAFCICIFLFICAGVAVASIYIGQGRVDIFEGVPDINIGDDKEDLINNQNKKNNETIMPSMSSQPTPVAFLLNGTESPSIQPSSLNGGTQPAVTLEPIPMPTSEPSLNPNVFETDTMEPTISGTPSPTEAPVEVVVIPDPIKLVASADTMIRSDLPSDSFGEEDFLLIQNGETIQSIALMSFELDEVYNVTEATSADPNDPQQQRHRNRYLRNGRHSRSRRMVEHQRKLSSALESTPFNIQFILQMDQILGIDPDRQDPPLISVSRVDAQYADIDTINQTAFERPPQLRSLSFTLAPDLERFNIDVTDLVLVDETATETTTIFLMIESQGEGNNEMGVLLRASEYQSGRYAPQLKVSFELKPTPAPVEMTEQPTMVPTTAAPTQTPITEQPSVVAVTSTSQPSVAPSESPTTPPPTDQPIVLTAQPFSFGFETPEPTPQATTLEPTQMPTQQPVLTAQPFSFGFSTPEPSLVQNNSIEESTDPTMIPSEAPTEQPLIFTAKPFSFGLETPEPSSSSPVDG